jgi:two-component sensor histidine kinase/predicted hydrocarbon binding protein
MIKAEIKKKIKLLEKELLAQKRLLQQEEVVRPETVIVPAEFSELFASIEDKVDAHFDDFHFDPVSGEITVEGQRYVLFRSDSMSHEFMDFMLERYSDRSEKEAASIANNFLYDNAKVIGKKDAVALHSKLDLKEPIEKLSAGPIHFAYTGWANVEISPESNPVANDDFVLKFQHHNSFEAQSWIKANKKSSSPVCTMNCGYSAGWCEESYGMPLTTVEVTCEAQGADACTFIMAPPEKIEQYVEEVVDLKSIQDFEIPVFFKRKNIEEKLRKSLLQKELLIKEIHHRVKNNLQVISSLLNLQMSKRANLNFQEEFKTSVNRVRTMAIVHEMLYQQKDFEDFKMSAYFKELADSLINTYYVRGNVDVEMKIDPIDKSLSLERSVPVALIMNEITCNSFKHGLKEGGKFYIYLEELKDQYALTIGDNGSGFEPNPGEDGLGLSLIDILCDQLDATKKVKNSKDGLEYKITFSK